MKLDEIYKILESVYDPEIPVITISELGILRNIELGIDDEIIVNITPTYTGCPAMDMIEVNIKSALQEFGFNRVKIISLLEPAWTTDWITESGKQKLMEYGISPPVEKTYDPSFLNGEKPQVPCPLCLSVNTSMISRFGSTACKSLYKCKDCLEPFDYFKCH